ncbi:MAG: hypothetical protein LBD94_00265, partial [Rickettsiales bacterium]|jgi:hypothetical protein|nr:hypothetical protein [Rickettsiales bacterium]
MRVSDVMAIKLCQKQWAGYSGGWSYSPTSGWGHTYYWWGETATIPVTGLYLVTTEMYAGDNDDDWHHYRAKSDGIFIPAGYKVAIYGTVRQARSNNCGRFGVVSTLYLLKPNGSGLLSAERTRVEGGPSDTGCGGGVCCGSSSNEDIDRGFSRISVRVLTPQDAAANGMLWNEAYIRGLM